MGRRKIEIKAIKDDRNRSVTFLKRKGGLFKKAHELSVLCSVDVAVFVFGNNKKLYEYSSIDMRDLIAKYQYHGGPSEHKGPSDFNGGTNDDDDDDDVDITPPPGHDGIETQMMPRHYQGQQQHPPPPPFPIVRHHATSVSPPMGNGVPFQAHQAHLQRNGTPQPPITSRPGSRNDMRHIGRGIVGQPVGPHGPHLGMTYGPPPPIYNHNPPVTQPNMIPPGASYAYQPHPSQQSYVEEHRPSAPPSFSIQPPPPPQVVPAGPRATPSPPQPPHQPAPSNAVQQHMSPQPERRHLDPQPPPPPVEPKADALERPKQQLLNTSDMAIKKMPPRKSHSIFTPIEENRSVLSQHLKSFAPDTPIKAESKPPVTLGPSPRSQSLDAAAMRNDKITSPPLHQRGSNRTPSVSSLPSLPESLNSPQTSSNSLKVGVPGGGRARGPRLTVQIPDGASEADSGTGDSTSPRNSDEPSSQTRQRHNSTTVVLPPPSPSAQQTLLSAGATGPPNPFARPPPQQNINGETPASALPSRFLNSELLLSPNSFYPEWNLRGPDSSNTVLSPMNFQTPVVGSGPSFLRDEAHSTSNGTSTSGVSVPTITTTAASDSNIAQPLGSTKRKISDAGIEPHDQGLEIPSEAKRLKV